ncbi:ribonuclease domain-containing protein [Enterobacter cloacae]|uniref:Ribonuclease n=1 Tax=Enterobacter cloacae TaxID=550 RepID=A0A144Q0Y9_ENTCL|nr:ribonuclease domain-containing protein [Enterobacter cloacae]CZV91044.1 guanine-specific ribonuclease N1 and T1 [Enterobacter cloacae]SAH23360.1 guanine-specific ribonuclease N1 and T1 [Enterobacter cloacae]
MTLSVALKKAVFFASLLAIMQANAALPTCENEIKDVNTFLSLQGAARINDVDDLAKTLRSLTQTGRLPSRYITSDDAKRLGWSGNETETLWGLKPTNAKWIGGDNYTSPKLPSAQSWYSADIDVFKGYRGAKRLIYTLSGPQRYITTDKYQHLVEVDSCN